jgi:hypothetical protein
MNLEIFTTIFILIQICNENWNKLGEINEEEEYFLDL